MSMDFVLYARYEVRLGVAMDSVLERGLKDEDELSPTPLKRKKVTDRAVECNAAADVP